MPLPDQDHPIWRLASQVVLLTILLVLTASKFDAGELTTVLAFLGGSAGLDKLLQGRS